MLGLAKNAMRMKQNAMLFKAGVGAGVLIGQGLESLKDERQQKAAEKNREKQARGESLNTLDLIKEHGLVTVAAVKHAQHKASKEK